jgi:hypothetical protein
MMRVIRIAVVVTMILPVVQAVAANAAKAKNQYHVIVVNLFTVQEGVGFPLDYLATMQEELMRQVKKKNPVFTDVLRPGETPSDPNARVVYLDGMVTEFHPGSRTLRYMVGPFVGKTKIVAHIRVTDPASDETFLEKYVDGKVIGGFIGGESIGATQGLANEVAKDAHKVF